VIEQLQLTERFSPQTSLIVTALNALFCLAVSVLLTVSGSAQDWWQNLQIAFGFGFSVQASIMVVSVLLKGRGGFILWAIAVITGLLIGSAWAQHVLVKNSSDRAHQRETLSG